MVEKVGFTNCVFEKLCFTENTIKIVFSANTAFQKQTWYVDKNRKLMKHSGLFLNMAKWCFLGLFFEVLVLLWFVFGVFGIVPGVLKMLVFPSLLGFSGVASSCLFLGLEGLGVFVFLVFLVFVFGVCVAFVSVLLVLFLFCGGIVFGVGSWFVFVFVFLFFLSVFLFWFFFVFFFFFVFCCFVFFEGLRVRWGGPKGHLTWP